MTGLFQDVRYALRQLRKNPLSGEALIIVLALWRRRNDWNAFAIVQSVLFRPLDYQQPQQLLLVGVSENGDEGYSVVSIEDFQRCNGVFISSSNSPRSTVCRFRWKPTTEWK